MKSIYKCIALLVVLLMMSCSAENEPFVVSADEYPRIMGRWPDRDTSGNLGLFEIPSNQTLSIVLQFTPSDFAVGTWLLNGIPVHEGSSFDFNGYDVGAEYNLKLEVKTEKYTTTREAIIRVLAPTPEE